MKKLLELLQKNKNNYITLSIKRNKNFSEKIEETYPNLKNTQDKVIKVKVDKN
jgi:hypothetical protein